MPLMDYHYRLLNQDIWKPDESSLRNKARTALFEQLSSRFPRAKGIYLVGDLTGHYYSSASDLDLLIRVEPEELKGYLSEAKIASGYFLPFTDHAVNYFLVPAATSPESLSTQFGPVYDVNTGRWYGKRITDTSELRNPEALLGRIRWALFKHKESFEVEPVSWKLVRLAFADLPPERREEILYTLRKTTLKLRKNVRGVVKSFNDADVWRQASEFDTALEEEYVDDDFVYAYVESGKLPAPVIYTILNKYRYESVLAGFEELDEQLRRAQRLREDQQAPVLNMYNASVSETPDGDTDTVLKKASKISTAFLWNRLDALLDLIIIHSGGYGKALNTVFKIFSHIMDNNRYILTEARKRRIVLRLYRKYYRHVKDA